MGRDASVGVEETEVQGYLQIGDLVEFEVAHDLPEVEVPFRNDRANSEGKQIDLVNEYSYYNV